MSYPIDDIVRGAGFKIMGTSGEAISVKKIIYLESDGYWYLADADAVGEMPVVAISCDPFTASGKKGEILLQGLIGSNSWSWTIGAMLYASTTPGEITESAPQTSQEIGVALSATMVYFNPSGFGAL